MLHTRYIVQTDQIIRSNKTQRKDTMEVKMGNEYARKRAQNTAFHTIDKTIEHLGLSEKVKEKAKSLYLEAQEKKLMSSRGLKVTVATLIAMTSALLEEEIDIEKIKKESGASEISFNNELDSLIDGLFPEIKED